MEYSKEIDSITKDQRYLIDYANIKSGLVENQNNFPNYEQFKNFLNNPGLGLPLVLPLKVKCFDYSSAKNTYNVSADDISNKLFGTFNQNYLGVKTFLNYGNSFCTDAKPKKEYNHIVNIVTKFNGILKSKINEIKKQGKTVGAFQTRNIPHLGHEKIIKKLLKHCDHVIINPVIGPKKKGDLKNNILELAYKFLSENFYKNRITYLPICANMFYAGPREAIHHSLLRKNSGFTYFIVGRDHAGADNIYNPDEAPKMAKFYEKEIGIRVITHQGSYFHKIKKKIIIKNNNDKASDLENISGSEFRKHLKNKTFYKFARYELQEYLYTLSDNYFIEYQ